ncbi:hypothetical protein IAU59_003354 [Kwoniella sp. CBS 9459]
MPLPPPPSPFHYLRTHHHPLSAVHFNASNTLLYSGDQEGWVSILDLRVRRMICFWRAHEGGVLGLEEWEGGLISHGRDNVIHFYAPLKKPYISLSVGSSSTANTNGTRNCNGNGTERYQTGPSISQSLPTNALNFCRFSLLPLAANPGASSDKLEDTEGENDNSKTNGKEKGKGKEREALMAVPSLTDSELVDIYHIPSLKRIHAAINYVPKVQAPVKDSIVPENGRSGLVMSLHLRHHPSTSSLTLSIGYEDGRVELYRSSLDAISISQPFDARMSSGPNPWKLAWKGKGHNEAVMGMDVDQQCRFVWSVSADHRLVRYDLGKVLEKQISTEDHSIMRDHSLKQIGNSCVVVRPDGRVVAVGGWDGKIRLFSTETLKPLGTLSSHRDTVHAITFANPPAVPSASATSDEAGVLSVEEASTLDLADNDSDGEESDHDEDDDTQGKGGVPRDRWFASGGKDTKVALWGLMDFGGAINGGSR